VKYIDPFLSESSTKKEVGSYDILCCVAKKFIIDSIYFKFLHAEKKGVVGEMVTDPHPQQLPPGSHC
jgi:hypothetical protein